MPDYLIVLNSPNGFQKKTVRAYLENNGEHRQIERKLDIDFDVEHYINNNFAQLWAIAEPLEADEWNTAFETQLNDLYRSIVQAAVQEARKPLATLSSVTTTMETVLLSSNKASAYTRLKTLAITTTSAERDAFFNMVGFLVVSKFIGK